VQRSSPVAEIFGYLVCLLAVAVFFISVAGIVNNAFRVVNPTAGPRMIGAHMLSGHGWRHPGPMAAPPDAMPAPPSGDVTVMRARFEGGARYDATRRLVLAFVMLVVAVLVFRRTFGWLNPRQGSPP
jgi:hypothetical protein